MLDDILAAVGLSKGAAIGGIFGAAVSLRFLGPMSWWKKLLTVASGAACAAFPAPLISEFFNLPAKVEGAVAFLVGLFALSFAAAVFNAMPGFIEALKTRVAK